MSDTPQEALIAKLLDALLATEWAWNAGPPKHQYCACCGRWKQDGHNAVCRVRSAIEAADRLRATIPAEVNALRAQVETLRQERDEAQALAFSRKNTLIRLGVRAEAAESQVVQLTRERELVEARLRGWQDFFSGQPGDLPFSESSGQAKVSQLNVAWSMGYAAASESELWKLMVARADRRAALSPETKACKREILRHADDSAAYLREPCTCGGCKP